MRPAFLKAFGNKRKFVGMSASVINKTNQKFKAELRKLQSDKKYAEACKNRSLDLWSQWLYDFDASKFEEEIELPGQYHGLSCPDLKLHRNLVSFDKKILILSSLRKPKRLKMRLDDGKEFMGLVKDGEDLRLDQRIEQLFEVMNSILKETPDCSSRKLYLRTYAVVPLTRSVGIIEWVPNTIPIKPLIQKELAKHENKAYRSLEFGAMKSSYHYKIDEITKNKGAGNTGTPYIKAIEKYDSIKKKLLKNWQNHQDKIPRDLLRRAMKSFCRGPESYIQIRQRFVRSFAVVTIANYLIGLGDRHLDNYLVDETTGEVISIDFGAAFGYGLGLPVPEMMPVRLTNQFCHLMSPLDTKRHMQFDMAHCMTAFQNEKDSLLNVMDVFVKEPSLDWVDLGQKTFNNASKNLIRELRSSESVSATQSVKDIWYPTAKLQIARMKLNRYSSVHVMIKEIDSTSHAGAKKKSLRRTMEKLISGDRDSMRYGCDERCESVENQMAIMIDHATDKNILSVTWQGWGSFI